MSQRRPPVRVIPTWTEPLAVAACRVVGGPLGRHAVVGRSRFWTPLRVVMLAAVLTLALGWLLKAPCLQQYPDPNGHLALDWRDGRQYVSLCYTDLVRLPSADRLAGPEPPYRAHWNDPTLGPANRPHYLDYPVLTGYFLWGVTKLVLRYEQDAAGGGLPTGLPEVVFFDLVAACFAVLWLAVAWTVYRQRRLRPWDAVLVAISPLALLHVFTGTEALGVGLAAGAMLAFARGRPVLSGLLLGLAASAKLYAALLVFPMLLVGRRRGEPGPALRAALAAGLTWFVVNAPVAVLATPGWLAQFRSWTSAAAEPDSVYYALTYFARGDGPDRDLPVGQTPVLLNLVVLGLFLACCLGIAVLARRAPRPPRLASLAFLVVAAALLVNKSWSPQFSLWLVPLAVLALPRWRLLLAWMTLDALVWVPRMFYYLGVRDKGLPADPVVVIVLLRDAMLVVLAVLVIRTVLRPETDPVRALGSLGGRDDPDWCPPRNSVWPQHPELGTRQVSGSG